MSLAKTEALQLRRKLGLVGCVDLGPVTDILGLKIVPFPFKTLKELTYRNTIGVAEYLSPDWKRWVVAHAIGHHQMHPGNHVWARSATQLTTRYESQAEEFARALLIDEIEAIDQSIFDAWEVAEHFGVPEELAALQGVLV